MLDRDRDGTTVGLNDGLVVGIAETDTTTATKENVKKANDFIVENELPDSTRKYSSCSADNSS